uniref:Uncharacterized protein n=1 Tax=Panagrolaimus sp. ES5 TaxID=591445 RepID=A0AC34GI35_9BILA
MMKNEFLIKFVASKPFLFSGNELSDALWNRYTEPPYTVSIIDENGKMMKGVLNCSDNEKMFQVFKSKRNEKLVQNNCYLFSGHLCQPYWRLQQPLTPLPKSNLITNDSISRYLVLDDSNLLLYVKETVHLKQNDILLAELHAEDGFQLKNCKIV